MAVYSVGTEAAVMDSCWAVLSVSGLDAWMVGKKAFLMVVWKAELRDFSMAEMLVLMMVFSPAVGMDIEKVGDLATISADVWDGDLEHGMVVDSAAW